MYQIDNPDNTITTNYIYEFRIRYYDKVFRNSDIYRVYLNTNNLPNYIKEIKFREKGSPYGDLISSKSITEEKIDNINYNLKLKNIFVLYCIILLIVILFFISNTSNIIYAILFIIDILLYYLIHLILSRFSILTLRFNFFDIILSFTFLIIAFNLLNKKILLTLLFEAINIFSFFVIEPIALTMQNTIIIFNDMPILYPSLSQVLSVKMKIILIISTIIYFAIIIFLIILFIINLIKMKRKMALAMLIVIFILTFAIFFRKTKLYDWEIDFVNFANKDGIINSINYRINFDRANKIVYSKEEVYKAINILKEREELRDYSSLLIGDTNSKRDIFLIFLESFYDYSHFVELFYNDPFPKEYKKWAENSRKIIPNLGAGSFYARLSGLTGSSPLYPKSMTQKIHYVLPDLLKKEGYYTLSLEEAGNTYNLANFLPSIGFEEVIFGLGGNNIKNYIDTNFYNLQKPIFIYGFTWLGHTDSHLLNNLNIAENNKNFINNFKDDNRLNINIIETLDNSVITAIEIIKIIDAILKYSPNALIIFKHDHLYPYLTPTIESSKIEYKYKDAFLNDYAPTPILIWNGTNGAYKVNNNFMPENIPMFIAINS